MKSVWGQNLRVSWSCLKHKVQCFTPWNVVKKKYKVAQNENSKVKSSTSTSKLDLKEYSSNLALHYYCITLSNSRWFVFKKKIKINAAEPEISFFFIPNIFLHCQNLAPTLPTMQLDHLTVLSEILVCHTSSGYCSLKQRWGAGYRGLVSSLLSNSTRADFFSLSNL